MGKQTRVPLLVIHWTDAIGSDDPKAKLAEALTVGWLIEETKDYIRVASEIFDDGDWRDSTLIPTGMIKSILSTGKRLALPVPFKKWKPEK